LVITQPKTIAVIGPHRRSHEEAQKAQKPQPE
jgi:hypothetical protein